MKRKIHYICMTLTLLLAVGGVVLIPRVNINSDMTKYLPDQSRMKAGLEIMSRSFSDNELAAADVKVLFPEELCANRKEQIATELRSREFVQSVSYKTNADTTYTLYELIVPKSVDQKALGVNIRSLYGEQIIVETSQDGATPPISALVIAGALILIILLIMGKSWLEPPICLVAMGVAVAINIGSNAFLPSVSITTNYIVAILQLVLSLDYSIIMINRFRQELEMSDGSEQSVTTAMNDAIRHSVRPIFSSALTTIVGLLMLIFMRLKIGTDMGVVLAKGVVCSLLCTFSLLPSLLMILHKAILKTGKPVPSFKPDKLARFVTSHKISMAVFILVLFGTAFYFSRKTNIYFSTNGERRIEKIFPKTNPFVVLYATEDEEHIFALADSISRAGGESVQAILSYPTLLKPQYTANELLTYMQQVSTQMSEKMPAIDPSFLSEEMIKMVYYLHSGAADTLCVTFRELMAFIRDDCADNPLFAAAIDDKMREQLPLLESILSVPEEPVEEPEPVVHATPVKPVKSAAPIKSAAPAGAVSSAPSANTAVHVTAHEPSDSPTPNNKIALIPFIELLYRAYPIEQVHYLSTIVDTVALREERNVRQMASYIGSTNAQTKMVYSLSKSGKRMTALEYVHFLTDDLFNRASLQSMVSQEQRSELQIRARFMDAANVNARISPKEMAEWLNKYGLNITEARVRSLAGIQWIEQPVSSEKEPLDIAEVSVVPEVENEEALIVKPKKHVKTAAERQAEYLERLLRSDRRYDAMQMMTHLSKLGQTIDTTSVQMLYAYYGTCRHYNESLTMSPEQMLNYVGDTLLRTPGLSMWVDSALTQTIRDTREQISKAIHMFTREDYSLMVVMTTLPDESEASYQFVERLDSTCQHLLPHDHYLIGESVMFSEMKNSFAHEMLVVTLLTILAIFVIVAFSFRSLLVPTILIITVLTAVYVNVVFSGLVAGGMLYLAYLIVQSILMGATIDYGILFTNYYQEYRQHEQKYEACREAYRRSLHTILTSGSIMALAPGAMALLVDDVAISAIVGCLSVGALMSVVLILCVLPAILVAFDAKKR